MNLRCGTQLLLLWLGLNSGLASEPQAQPPTATEVVGWLLEEHCGYCHGADEAQAGLRLDQLSRDLVVDHQAARQWQKVSAMLDSGQMPPADEPPLAAADRQRIVDWIATAIRQATEVQRQARNRTVMRRLNRDEYQHTLRDLLGIDIDYIRDLPPDGLSPEGYANHGQALGLSGLQLEFALAAARRGLQKAIVTGPPPQAFRYRFEQSNVTQWLGATEFSNRLERSQKFLVKMVDEYPEQGEFRIRVLTRAQLKADKGFPLLQVDLGYRPDTQIHMQVVGTKEVLGEQLQQFEFSGRLENFPLPVRGQGKYPGLVIQVSNVYDDGSPLPKPLKIDSQGKKFDLFPAEPHLPQLIIEAVEFEGPVIATWPPAQHQEILFESELRRTAPLEYLRQVLARFMRRAFRRPVTAAEVEPMLAHFTRIRPEFPSFEEAVRETLAMVLIQPEFLFRIESPPQRSAHKRSRLSDWALASRLSYFLWGTMPDERLFDLAEAGLLHQPSVLKAETLRLLEDQRNEQFVRSFTHQWLRLDNVQQVAVDRALYPDCDERLKALMQRETVTFFDELLRSNESALGLLNANFMMLNERLARHYGIERVWGDRFRRVPVDPATQRGGLLSQASVLLANSDGRDSHVIRRAVWLRDRLLDDPPAPPPPNVPPLASADPAFAKLSLREQLVAHRDQESCAACHRDLDPWGIPLEGFDAVGRQRDTIEVRQEGEIHRRPVIAMDRLPDGTIVDGVAQLRQYLVQHRSRQFARSLVVNLLTYALGRSLDLADQDLAEQLTDRFVRSDYQLQTLILSIVSSDAFRAG